MLPSPIPAVRLRLVVSSNSSILLKASKASKASKADSNMVVRPRNRARVSSLVALLRLPRLKTSDNMCAN